MRMKFSDRRNPEHQERSSRPAQVAAALADGDRVPQRHAQRGRRTHHLPVLRRRTRAIARRPAATPRRPAGLVAGFGRGRRVLHERGRNGRDPRTWETLKRAAPRTSLVGRRGRGGRMGVRAGGDAHAPAGGGRGRFPSKFADGSDVPQTWHAGCASRGPVKYTLQFFREPPSAAERQARRRWG